MVVWGNHYFIQVLMFSGHMFSPFSTPKFMLGIEWSNLFFEGPRLRLCCHCWWRPWYGIAECYSAVISRMGKTVFISGFSRLVTVDRVREFLEQRTGKDTIYAIKVRPHKRGAGSHAFVQFMDSGYAKLIISLARQGLRYGCSHLTAGKAERDVVQRPRTLSHSIEGIALHFGCQVSTRRFATLWTGVNVTVNFGAGPRKFCFLMSYSDTEYRLELSYENIWQIELHRPRGRTTMYLVIQVSGLHLNHKTNLLFYANIVIFPPMNIWFLHFIGHHFVCDLLNLMNVRIFRTTSLAIVLASDF